MKPDGTKAVRDRSARYTNLSPGKYKFIVRASNSDGIWNEEGRTLSIIINPPPWATWWAYTLYLIFAVGFLYTIRRVELDRKLNNAKIQESQLQSGSCGIGMQSSRSSIKSKLK